MGTLTRRDFTRTSIALGVTTALGSMRVLGANDRVAVGLIGCGGRGSQVADRFLKMADASLVAVADVYSRSASERWPPSKAGGHAAAQRGSRRECRSSARTSDSVLDRKDVDAVDHRHAGPLARADDGRRVARRQGRLRREAAVARAARGPHHGGRGAQDKRVCAVGSQQRSGAHYAEAVRLIREGAIGTVHHVHAGMTRNAMPGFVARELRGGLTDALDWDMWLGPAPKVPFDPFRAIYHFRWFWDYSGGQMTNWGAHHLDIARWALGAKAPDGRRRLRRPLRDQGRRRDAGRPAGALPVRLGRRVVEHARGQRGRPRRAGVLRHQGHARSRAVRLHDPPRDVDRRRPTADREAAAGDRRPRGEGREPRRAARPQLPRLREVAAATERRRRGRPSLGGDVPPRQPLDTPRPLADLGRRARARGRTTTRRTRC